MSYQQTHFQTFLHLHIHVCNGPLVKRQCPHSIIPRPTVVRHSRMSPEGQQTAHCFSSRKCNEYSEMLASRAIKLWWDSHKWGNGHQVEYASNRLNAGLQWQNAARVIGYLVLLSVWGMEKAWETQPNNCSWKLGVAPPTLKLPRN